MPCQRSFMAGHPVFCRLNFLQNCSGIQLFHRKNQVPVFTPNDIAVFQRKTAEFPRVEVFVVLWMWMATNEVANVHRLHGIVAESQADGQISCILGLSHINVLHIVSSYSFFLMFVLRMLCFRTKNFTHLSMIFL